MLNPYDHCVANCDINSSQCTIAWYVDDTKISRADPSVVTDVIQKIKERFGMMTVTRGKDYVSSWGCASAITTTRRLPST